MTIPIACAQIACSVFDPGSNLDKADHFIREAAQQGAKLILLPECLTTGYTYDRRLHDFAEPIGGSSTRWLQRRSRQTGCWIGAGIVERGADGIFDTFVLTGPDGEVLSYRKRHPAFFEMLYFGRGREIGIFNTALGRIGVMICWDMVHARLAQGMDGRIDLLLVTSAWPDVSQGNIPLYGMRGWLSRPPRQRPPQLALELNVPVAYCNMRGAFITKVPGLGLTYRCPFAGCSSITDHEGQTVKAIGTEEAVFVADVRVGEERGPKKAA
ncbi:MAG: carbon-nitrogen hydrolase family protein [Planctomycetota bacterium]|nr:MAG: carbon-nitrogen hydrolase family protein [Planctomycetota bacterium]